MKVDIEGAEEAFLSGRADLLRGVRNLIIEVHPGRCDHEKLLRELRAGFPYGHEVPGRASAKPLLLFSRTFPSFPAVAA